MKNLTTMSDEELFGAAKEMSAPLSLVKTVARLGKLPVPNFAAGGVATPADAALVMKLGAESVFVGSGIFKASNPEQRGKAIVTAVTQFNDPKALADCSRGLGEAMKGVPAAELPDDELLQVR
jgi:pyridoxal 5'-phosphate synthase pdxS subunit